MRLHPLSIAALTLTGLVGLTALGAAAGESSKAPATDRAAATRPAEPLEKAAAIDAWLARRLDAHVVLDQADAQKKALDYIGSRKAHADAVLKLQQCRNCHDRAKDVVRLSGPQPLRIAVAGPDTPWVGVSVGPADDVLRSQLKLPEGTGVVVTKVMPDGPAQKADVREHDILLSVNGQPVASGDALDAIVKGAKADSPPLTLKLLREGQPLEKQVVPSRETQQWLSALTDAMNPRSPYRIGVSVSEPDETLRSQLRLGDSGLVVTAVTEGSPAEKQGVKVNDVLLGANGRAMKEGGDLPDTVSQAEETPVELELLRGGVRLKITVTPEKDQAAAVSEFLSAAVTRDAENQELTLLEPGFIYRATTDLSHAREDANKPQTQPSGAPNDRINQIVSQLDDLRAAVEALRADVTKDNDAGSPKQK
jgi:membrane-associated protease RseP (regulator of RpoE activity)